MPTYATDPETGKTYIIDDANPALMQEASVPIPAYSLNDYGNWVFNPNNSAGIPINTDVSGNTGSASLVGLGFGANPGQSSGGSGGMNQAYIDLLRSFGIDPNAVATGGQGSSNINDWGTNQTNYYNDYLKFLQDQDANNLALENKKLALESMIASTNNANTKVQLEQQLMQINAQIAQSQAEMEQRKFEFGQTFGLNQQSQDWLQNYQQQQIDLQKSQQALDQKNYLAQLASKPINWLQYNQAANMPTVSQPFMEKLGGPVAGTVISGQQYLPKSSNAGSVGNTLETGGYASSSSQPAGTPNQMGLSQLTTPSMQTYNNFTPTERGLYAGYQQALTGDSEEDTNWKLWNRAPPTSGSTINYSR